MTTAGWSVGVYNLTRRCWLAEDAEEATSFWKRLRGLLGRPSLPPGGAVVLRPCNSVHTLGMRFPIDVVYADKDWQVVRICADMPAWRVSGVVRGAKQVVELPAGVAAETGLRLGDSLVVGPLGAFEV